MFTRRQQQQSEIPATLASDPVGAESRRIRERLEFNCHRAGNCCDHLGGLALQEDPARGSRKSVLTRAFFERLVFHKSV